MDANCTNTFGGYECECFPRYVGDGRNCSFIDYCENDKPCAENATCTSDIRLLDGFGCECPNGTIGDAITACTDIDECSSANLNECHKDGKCTNNFGSYECSCHTGYNGDGKDCSLGDACDPNPCDENAVCTTVVNETTHEAAHKCACSTGWQGNGYYCLDINECLSGDTCDDHATCENSIGGFTCTCKNKWEGDGIGYGSCTNIDECASDTTNDCLFGATCIEADDGYSCQCQDGYEGNGIDSCSDIDECAVTDPKPCVDGAECTNYNGGYYCDCGEGYEGDGKELCQNIDECALNTHTCHWNATCTDTEGSFKCDCAAGYSGNGEGNFGCVEINECDSPELNNCNTNANCINTPGSFTCKCKTGYTGTGLVCDNVDECLEGSDDCDENASCIDQEPQSENDPGFTCECDTGYQGDGVTCTQGQGTG